MPLWLYDAILEVCVNITTTMVFTVVTSWARTFGAVQVSCDCGPRDQGITPRRFRRHHCRNHAIIVSTTQASASGSPNNAFRADAFRIDVIYYSTLTVLWVGPLGLNS